MTDGLHMKHPLLEVFIRVFVAAFIGVGGSWAIRGSVDIQQAFSATLIFLLFNVAFEIYRRVRNKRFDDN